jgi:hypothetical protein
MKSSASGIAVKYILFGFSIVGKDEKSLEISDIFD